MTPPFDGRDLAQLAAAGIALAEAERQLRLLATPAPPARLARPCTVGDGILRLTPGRFDELERRGAETRAAGRLSKFVPASGAATRMFAALVAVRARGLAADRPALERAARSSDAEAGDAVAFARALPDLALARPLAEVLGVTVEELARRAAAGPLDTILSALLDPTGLDAARRPKALLAFHLDGERPLTAFEEQLREGLAYLTDRSERARFHFTVPPGETAVFESALAEARARVGAGASLEVAFSEQARATDTLALDEEGRPARTADGRLLLRPSGHGALLGNLEATGGDLVFVKNIDNILPRLRHAELARWKLALAGLAAELADGAAGVDRDRPLRVAGVVPNAGEPGGGPFWVEDLSGVASLQIVESAQVARGDAGQRAIFGAATHFNPVDLVVALRDAGGRPHRLDRFVDPASSFVTAKVENGRRLTVLERPGLWNGAMAGWRTVFVDIPAWTFAPVKTVLDLARPEHRAI
jgi:hypothetical protein